jgi:hypothetical protein
LTASVVLIACLYFIAIAIPLVFLWDPAVGEPCPASHRPAEQG